VAGPASDVLDHHCARGGAVALPQFVSVDAVGGSEVERRAHGGEFRGVTAAGSTSDVLDQHRARGGAVALPQFDSVTAVGGFEVERRAYGGEMPGPTAGGPTVDVLDHHCALGGSVAPPQFDSVTAVVGFEVERRAHDGELIGVTGADSAVDVLQNVHDVLGTISGHIVPLTGFKNTVLGCSAAVPVVKTLHHHPSASRASEGSGRRQDAGQHGAW